VNRILKKHAELALRNAAKRTDNEKRHITKDAIDRASYRCYELLELSCLYLLRCSPESGRNSKIHPKNIDDGFDKLIGIINNELVQLLLAEHKKELIQEPTYYIGEEERMLNETHSDIRDYIKEEEE
tara:strand:- start:7207 stop:7587 length:381 start_codon:yes stop_codon:yes gene_type:complete